MHYRSLAAAMTIAACGLTVAIAGPAVAAPATAQRAAPGIAGYPCGYDGYDGSSNDLPLYNHCGTGDIVLHVDHLVGPDHL